MSYSFIGRSRQAIQILISVVILTGILALCGAGAQAAGIVRVGDQIAQAKARVFGEYPEVEAIRPEIVRPEPAVTIASATPKAPIAAESRATAKASAKTKAKPAAPSPAAEPKAVPAKAEVPAQQAEAKAPEAQQEPAATIEAVAVSAPAPVATEAPAAVEATGDIWVDEILRLVNEARATEGLSALTINSKAQEAAAIRVVELPNSPAPHLRPDGSQFYTVFAEVGLNPKTGGENYAIGTANAYSPDQIVTAWLNSAGHRKNIMNASYKQIGIGHAIIGDKEYFEQLFIG